MQKSEAAAQKKKAFLFLMFESPSLFL